MFRFLLLLTLFLNFFQPACFALTAPFNKDTDGTPNTFVKRKSITIGPPKVETAIADFLMEKREEHPIAKIENLETLQQKSGFLTAKKLSLTALTLSLIILILWRSIVLARRSSKQSALLAEQARYIDEIQSKLAQNAEIVEREEHFKKNLQHAEMTTELQKSRSSFVHQRNSQRPPERYEYAKSMFKSGMATAEISAALGMSNIEITQLIKLSSLRKQAEQLKQN
ncbi:hypothetical protein JYT30_00485 [Desulfotalea psychrophila]|nr:hypothetical protein [Desulfocapsa sp.]MBN4065666.1 hypothetical protein [Desulfocapsa sp. AH-315-G09]MBN4071618.1 hypothetical protein [Desulfotalea psychrophila]